MPELPEVTIFNKFFDETALGRRIQKIKINSSKIVRYQDELFTKDLVGNTLVTSKRVGKNLFIGLSNGKFMVVHFGMTGAWDIFQENADEPKYSQVIFFLDNGLRLVYLSKRKFGFLEITENIPDYLSAKKIGKDALEISFEEFKAIFKGKKAVKSRLMEQDKISGIGNWVSDEILYQSQIHPETSISNLEEKDINTLFEKLHEVLSIAIEGEANHDTFPKYFLTHNRMEGGICFYTGKNIKRIVVGGRGTYLSTTWQHKK